MVPNRSDSESESTSSALRFAVVGAGISGLSAALRLVERHPQAEVCVYESADRAGGVLQTIRRPGYLIERAADNFLRGPTAPWAEQFCQEHGLADQLIPTNSQNRGAHVVREARLYPVPEGFQLMAPSKMSAIMRSPLLSYRGRMRLAFEPLIREPSWIRDESLTEFATRRLGREAFERLVQPLVAGIYTADSDRLSVAAALPQMVDMVREHGSLYAGMRARQRAAKSKGKRVAPSPTDPSKSQGERGARYSLFVAPREGMSHWIDQIVARLGPKRIQYGVTLRQLRCNDNHRWELHDESKCIAEVDGVIVATPVGAAASLLQTVKPKLAQELSAIPCASSAVVCCAYDRGQISSPLNAFGCVVPASEQRKVLAISYSSNKFPNRAPDGKVLLRIFLGGALQPDLLQREDQDLIQLAEKEVGELLGISGKSEFSEVVRWPSAMPQYEIGHLERVDLIESLVRELPGLTLTGNAFHGVGVPQCIRGGQAAADQLWDDHKSTS